MREAPPCGPRGLHRRSRLPQGLAALAARGAAARCDRGRHRLPPRGLPLHRGESRQGMSALTFLALRELADGRFHSGEEVSRTLGRSRATLSEALRKAPELGIEIFSVRGRGYRLAEPIEFLDREAVAQAIAGTRIDVEIVDEIPSTSTRLLERAAEGAPSGLCLAAEWQSAGRGRRGRTWVSSVGGSLTFSLLW